MAKKTIPDFQEMKERGEKITYLVIYDYWTARLAQEAGIDMILVGDSLLMGVYGYPNTTSGKGKMERMIFHCDAVCRGVQEEIFVIGDMPDRSYPNPDKAVRNAKRFQKAGADAIKLEGGRRVIKQIEAIVNAGIPVMVHLGLLPQTFKKPKPQGLIAEDAQEIILDARAAEKAGAFAVLLEAVPAEVGKIITEELKIPVLSIGAGPCDGSLLLKIDLLKEGKEFAPEFAKNFVPQALVNLISRNLDLKKKILPDRISIDDLIKILPHLFEGIGLKDIILESFKVYVEEVKQGIFPDPEKHYYRMKPGEYEKLLDILGIEKTDQKKEEEEEILSIIGDEV